MNQHQTRPVSQRASVLECGGWSRKAGGLTPLSLDEPDAFPIADSAAMLVAPSSKSGVCPHPSPAALQDASRSPASARSIWTVCSGFFSLRREGWWVVGVISVSGLLACYAALFAVVRGALGAFVLQPSLADSCAWLAAQLAVLLPLAFAEEFLFRGVLQERLFARLFGEAGIASLPASPPASRKVLDCGSPLPLWERSTNRKRQRTAAVQDAGAPTEAFAASWPRYGFASSALLCFTRKNIAVSTLFAAAHVILVSPWSGAGAFVGGLVLGRVMEKSAGSLWPVTALHTLANLAVGWFTLLARMNTPWL